jgi:hypothetical protein
MKPKVVAKPQPVSIPVSKANRELTTFEKATSWVDEQGMISVDEGIKRVFLAAMENGEFTVVTNVRRGRSEVLRYRSFLQALPIAIHYHNQERLPLLYATTHNREALIDARSYKDPDTGKWVAKCDAVADVYQYFLNLHCSVKGIKNIDPAPMIQTMRTPKRKVPRERLPTKIKRERL